MSREGILFYCTRTELLIPRHLLPYNATGKVFCPLCGAETWMAPDNPENRKEAVR